MIIIIIIIKLLFIIHGHFVLSCKHTTPCNLVEIFSMHSLDIYVPGTHINSLYSLNFVKLMYMYFFC